MMVSDLWYVMVSRAEPCAQPHRSSLCRIRAD